MAPIESPRIIYSVSELNGSVRLLLSTHFGAIWVEGEVSNLSMPSSGHCYFTLKDFDAQVRCAMFRGSVRGLGFRPQDGMRVLVRAQVSLYEPRGDYQLIVDYLEEAGDGALRRTFEVLKQKLAAEGLFDSCRKRSLPVAPSSVGVITSPTGAAIRDILTVLKRRFPALPAIIYPVRVQGNDAKFDIARSIALANALDQCEVLILARGGGSLEDLWAFNEEVVARAIADSRIPVVSGVGHETDTTIADLVADYRAATPSAAAAAVCPDQSEWLARFERLERQLTQRFGYFLDSGQQKLGFLLKRLMRAHPEKALQRQSQRLDELELRLRRSMGRQLAAKQMLVGTSSARLQRHHPGSRLQLAGNRLSAVSHRLAVGLAHDLSGRQSRVGVLGQRLQSVSPLATLSRGYSIICRQADGQLITQAGSLDPGDLIENRLMDGVVISRVEQTSTKP